MQRKLYDKVSTSCSRHVTQAYSTSFSLGIRLLARELHDPIYAIYGFVRLADEIVDSFHDGDQVTLFAEFREATDNALVRRLSVNPILHAFQQVVHRYGIDRETIDTFLLSMETDLTVQTHSRASFEQYIVGSAEVVGLMCLRVFVDGNDSEYEKLKPAAMRLGAAFQKVNFLRDMHVDYVELGRMYFPGISFESFSEDDKRVIEDEIHDDFDHAVRGIRRLPPGPRLGVYTAYLYYRRLFEKIRRTPAVSIRKQRIRISNPRKIMLMCTGMVRHNLGQLV